MLIPSIGTPPSKYFVKSVLANSTYFTHSNLLSTNTIRFPVKSSRIEIATAMFTLRNTAEIIKASVTSINKLTDFSP